MRGSINHQVQQVFYKSGIEQFGVSKHQAKLNARETGAKTWQEIGAQLGIYSYATADAYREVWRQLLHFTKTLCGVNDIEKLTVDHIERFLYCVSGRGVAKATYKQYSSAVAKLEQALHLYSVKYSRGNTYDFSTAIASARVGVGCLVEFSGSRAYENPWAVVDAMSGDYCLAARLQLESGARVDEVALIKSEQLSGLGIVPATGDVCGVFVIKGKGGKVGEKYVSREAYGLLIERVDRCIAFKIDKNIYRAHLSSAAKQTGQDYQGSHGLRWNYAQSRFASVQSIGELTYEQGLIRVSEDMGHQRADITEHYLK